MGTLGPLHVILTMKPTLKLCPIISYWIYMEVNPESSWQDQEANPKRQLEMFSYCLHMEATTKNLVAEPGSHP